MQPTKLKTAILLLFCFFTANSLLSQTIDDSACWSYFNITKELKQNKPLDKNTWNNFLQNRAVQVYFRDQGVDSAYLESYRRIMEIVYQPKNDSILQKCLKEPYKYWWVYIVNEYKVNEDKMKAYLQNLQSNPAAYLDTCYKYAYSMLPAKDHKTAPKLKITIIPVHNDAHVEEGWMIFTLMAAYFGDNNKNGTLGGHEFHHILRPKLVFNGEGGDDIIINAFQRILNEGTADLVDKRYEGEDAVKLLEFQRGYPESFLQEGPIVLKNIDSILSSANLDKSGLKIRTLINASNTSGHIPGYYMTNVIERNGMKNQLIKHIEDPFFFVYLYNKAAKKDKNAVVISEETIQLLRSIDTKYRKEAKLMERS